MSESTHRNIVFENVSKFYGEVLGLNRVDLVLPPGVTSLVGPNGSGKSTLMNLMTGLLRPSEGRVSVLGVELDDPERLFRAVGYATQFDHFPRGLTGYRFVESYLRLHGFTADEARRRTERAIERVGLGHGAHRKIGAYSKGMRQRVKLAHAIAHDPSVLVLDEPLNGLDPVGRSEVISLFRELAEAGLHVIISSHILHEVDLVSDRVVLLDGGYVVAEGGIRDVREDLPQHPSRINVRCDRPSELASRTFALDHVVAAEIHDDGRGLTIRTQDSDRFYALVGEMVTAGDLRIDGVAASDDDVHAVYDYLIGNGGGSR